MRHYQGLGYMETPLVSIIIRTCGRPQLLQNALHSIQEQEYSNIETIVVEDGPNVSEKFILEKFPDLNVRYFCLGRSLGRCKAGNKGMQESSGVYLNFLDDDDLLLPKHVSILVENLETSKYQAAYSISEEYQIRDRKSVNGTHKIKRKLVRYKQPYSKLLLCYMNYIPIQSIMFQKSLFEQYGGLDEHLKMLEDWDLWVRYSAHSDFLFVPVITSVYHTPYKGKKKHRREAGMHHTEDIVIQKYKQYQMTFDAEQINKDMDYILNIYNKKGFLFYLQKIRNFLLYRDI